ncbi:transcriptional repressor [Helicobacter sp. 23-1045]
MAENKIKRTESLESVITRLQRVVTAKQLKTSKQREHILALIYNSKTHLSPEEITNALKGDDKNSSLSSVYRILQFLETYGFLTSVETKSGKRYEIAAKEHHYHIICLGCGNIMEFVDDDIREKQSIIAKTLKCELISDNLRLFVLCGKCLGKKGKGLVY